MEKSHNRYSKLVHNRSKVMKYQIKIIYGNNSSTTYINESDARMIAGQNAIDNAVNDERNNQWMDGTEIKITNTLSVIAISEQV